MDNNSLTQEINQLHTRICSAISEPNRILLLYAVADKPVNVNKLAEIVGISQSAASRHLKVLREVMLDQLSQQADLFKQNQSNER